jgi:hypothetical protein
MLGKISIAVVLVCFISFQDACCGQRAQDQSSVPGQVLVKLYEGVSREEAKAVHHRLGSRIVKHYQRLNIDLVAINCGLAVEEAIKLYQEDPHVAYAEPNYRRRTKPKKSADPI